jgi:hypothetical protein
MSEVIKLLERQAAWQKSRKDLSWPEKIRMAEAIRESVLQLRRSESKPAPPDKGKDGMDRKAR